MSPISREDILQELVKGLVKLPKETEWVEFKENDENPEEIGQYISALSNSAVLAGRPRAYIIWGVVDTTHKVVGTTFKPKSAKKGNEELESWLLHLLTPKVRFEFYDVLVNGMNVVVLEIERAVREPIQFQGVDYIRIGSYKKRLKDYHEKERELWRAFENTPFEKLIAEENLYLDQMLAKLNYPAYFELLGLPLPDSKTEIADTLVADELVSRNDYGIYSIRNLGAILLAKKLADFPTVRRKTVRLVIYKGTSRVETLRETEGTDGYAVGFKGLIEHLMTLIPTNEVIAKAIRKNLPMYPPLAIRELVANALIHQDFSIPGAGPMVEVFDDRLEVTNPGKPLVKTDRFLDSPPRSRNESLASFMRRVGICEERGSGIDKVVSQTEFYQLPAPTFEVVEENTRVVLFSHRPTSRMDKADRVRACYLHACLKYVNMDFMTNASIRERFKISVSNSATASRYIKEALTADKIKLSDGAVAPKLRKYVPIWA